MKPAGRNPFNDELVASHYEAWYETAEGRWADAQEKELLAKLLAGFPRADTLLEIGCGTGHFSRWFSGLGLTVTGLDLSPAMLAQAQALGEDETIAYVDGDAYQLPFADGAFELVALVTTLEFLAEPETALQEAARVARQGLLLGVLNRWSLMGLQCRLVGLFRPAIFDTARFYGVGELSRLVRRAVGQVSLLTWDTTLWPRPLPLTGRRFPWGGFIGMSVSLRVDLERKEVISNVIRG